MKNKRLHELAEQAGFVYINDEGIGWAGMHNRSLPKFAELIVSECVKIIDETPLGYGDYRDQILKSMRDHCVERVKDHFGE